MINYLDAGSWSLDLDEPNGVLEYQRDEDQFYLVSSFDSPLAAAFVPKIKITHDQAEEYIESALPVISSDYSNSAENEPVLLEIGRLFPNLAELVEECMMFSRVGQTLELAASLSSVSDISFTLEPDEYTRELHYSPVKEQFLLISTKLIGETVEAQIMMLSRDEAKNFILDHPIVFSEDPETCEKEMKNFTFLFPEFAKLSVKLT